MKKIIGWIMIILCSLMLLFFTIFLIVALPEILIDVSEDQMSIKEIFKTILGFFIIVVILILGLTKGINKIKKDKKSEFTNYDKVLDINFKGKIDYIDYRNLSLELKFKKHLYLILPLTLLILLMIFVLNEESSRSKIDSSIFLLIYIGIFLFIPILTIIEVKKLYNTNSIFQEMLSYNLTNESIHIKGDKIDSIQKWSHFYGFKESKNFFLFYQGKMVATLIDKKMFSDNDLQEFIEFIKSLKLKTL